MRILLAGLILLQGCSTTTLKQGLDRALDNPLVTLIESGSTGGSQFLKYHSPTYTIKDCRVYPNPRTIRD